MSLYNNPDKCCVLNEFYPIFTIDSLDVKSFIILDKECNYDCSCSHDELLNNMYGTVGAHDYLVPSEMRYPCDTAHGIKYFRQDMDIEYKLLGLEKGKLICIIHNSQYIKINDTPLPHLPEKHQELVLDTWLPVTNGNLKYQIHEVTEPRDKFFRYRIYVSN